MKTCSACGQTLPLSSFPVRRASRDGLGYSCRDCKNAQNKNHYDNNKKTITRAIAGCSPHAKPVILRGPTRGMSGRK